MRVSASKQVLSAATELTVQLRDSNLYLFLYFCHLSSLLVVLEHEGSSHPLFKHAHIDRP